MRFQRWLVVALLVVCGFLAAANVAAQAVRRPAARLFMGRNIPLSTNGSPTVVVFDSAVFDTSGFWSSSARDLLKVPAGLGGLYLVSGGVLLKGGLVNTGVWMDVRREPEFFEVCGQSGSFLLLGFTPPVAVLSCSALIVLAEGQMLHLSAYGFGGAGGSVGPTGSPLVGASIDLTYLSLVKLD
jgi:hypothetical protein